MHSVADEGGKRNVHLHYASWMEPERIIWKYLLQLPTHVKVAYLGEQLQAVLPSCGWCTRVVATASDAASTTSAVPALPSPEKLALTPSSGDKKLICKSYRHEKKFIR